MSPRVLSALVLAPIALGMAWAGPWPFAGLLCIAAILMAHELGRMLLESGDLAKVSLLALAGMAAVLLTALGTVPGAVLVTIGFMLVGLANRLARGQKLWTGVVAYLYLCLPLIAFAWLRVSPQEGLLAVVWLLMLVWMTDTFAYLSGSMIGGPKLAPRISPSKTWAGFVGGIIGATLVGVAAAELWGQASHLQLGAVSAAVGMLAQLGDLFESALKRRAGLKDSGRLIPGHGGLLDRVDGLVAAAGGVGAFALANAIMQGNGSFWG